MWTVGVIVFVCGRLISFSCFSFYSHLIKCNITDRRSIALILWKQIPFPVETLNTVQWHRNTKNKSLERSCFFSHLHNRIAFNTKHEDYCCYNIVQLSQKLERATHSTSSAMDRTHADGIWFSSWESSLLLFLIGGGKKRKQQAWVHDSLLVQHGEKAPRTGVSCKSRDELYCVLLMSLLVPVYLLSSVCLPNAPRSAPAAPTLPCITVPAPLCGLWKLFQCISKYLWI